MNGFFGAVQFLTRVPVPTGEYKLEDAYVWFAPVGLLIGALLALADAGLRLAGIDPLVSSAVLVSLWLATTGALHADGLMDTCDAVFAHATPERRLEIMRDPHTGAFGIVGFVCIALLKFAALDALPSSVRPQTLILAPGLGRWSITLLSALFPYGREVGLGAPLKAAATKRALAIATLAPLVACAIVGPVGLVLGGLTLVVAWLLGRWLMTLLPGLTGDCYGAMCEVVEAAVVVCAAPVAHALG